MHHSGTPNRLIREKSPYLLQHAYNPVDWYPWGEEAFEKARREDKPIFLSVGYSTCHWCHVMERESFVDQGVADLLNKGFVSIKVDREERPDVDHVYMEAVMAMTGAGGWPMSVFLTADLKPFYGGTYFPPRDGHGRPGFGTVLLAIEDKWKNDRAVLHDAGGRLTEAIRGRAAQSGQIPEVRYPELAARAFQELEMRYDAECGGFGEAPKFPTPHVLSFLLLDSLRSGRSEAQAMAEATLEAMARGGLRDALGGGFHRYSTDERWHVPHFEKMLYDQALLVRAYAEAFQLTGKGLYREVAVEIMEYVLRDLTSPEGAFYSAEDADSAEDAQRPDHKTEGAFYVWTMAELRQALAAREAEVFAAYYGCGETGNVLQDPFGEFQNKNVLYQTGTMQEVAARLGMEPGEVKIFLDRARPRLLEWRNRRPRPHLDDKVLTDWNGLMISAMAYAGRVFGESRYVDAAAKAADFILTALVRSDGRILHRWREGEAAIPGFLDDYAFILLGLIDLFTASQKAGYLKEALRMAKDLVWLFEDDAGGPGLFFTARDAEVLFTRQKTYYDGAVPAGNSAAAWALAQLSLLSENPVFREKARRVLHGHLNTLGDRASLYPLALLAFDLLDGGGEEIVLAGPQGDEINSWFVTLGKEFAPGRLLILNPSGEAGEPVRRLLPFLSQRSLVQGKVTAWVCRRGACLPPVTSREVLNRVLQGGAGQGG